MQTASDSARIAARSYAIGVAGADGWANAGEESSVRAIPDTRVESNVPGRWLIADGAAALARIGRAMEIARLDRDRADGPEIRHDFELVAHLLERATRRRGHRLFDDDDIGLGLLVDSRFADGACRVHMKGEDVERDLQHAA